MSLNAYNIPLFFAKRKAWQKKWDNGCLKKAIVSQKKSLSKEMVGFLELIVQKDRFGDVDDIFSYFIAKGKEEKVKNKRQKK